MNVECGEPLFVLFHYYCAAIFCFSGKDSSVSTIWIITYILGHSTREIFRSIVFHSSNFQAY